jgi:mRNA interferase MazF
MTIRQFEIWMANLNPGIGTEPGKTRPVVIVQTDLLNQLHPSTVICPVTTNVKPDSEILRVHLNKKPSGLLKEGDIMIDQIRAIDNRRLIRRVGVLTPRQARSVKENLKCILDLI